MEIEIFFCSGKILNVRSNISSDFNYQQRKNWLYLDLLLVYLVVSFIELWEVFLEMWLEKLFFYVKLFFNFDCLNVYVNKVLFYFWMCFIC